MGVLSDWLLKVLSVEEISCPWTIITRHQQLIMMYQVGTVLPQLSSITQVFFASQVKLWSWKLIFAYFCVSCISGGYWVWYSLQHDVRPAPSGATLCAEIIIITGRLQNWRQIKININLTEIPPNVLIPSSLRVIMSECFYRLTLCAWKDILDLAIIGLWVWPLSSSLSWDRAVPHIFQANN